MELYVGGISQGKLLYVLHKKGIDDYHKLLCDGVDCSKEDVLRKPVINHFHSFIRRLLIDNEDVEAFLETFIQTNSSAVVICNEVGYGIVPIDKGDRIYREVVGRSCCKIAECADTVERIVCGMGQKIK